MARVTTRRVREILVNDTENGVQVLLDHRVTAQPTADPRAVQASTQAKLLAELHQTVSAAQSLYTTVPDAPTQLPTIRTASDEQPLPAEGLVVLTLVPAPIAETGANPDTATLYTLLAGLANDNPKHTIACELVATDTTVTFQVITSSQLASIVMRQLYAAYPTAAITAAALTSQTPQLIAPNAGCTLSFQPADAALRVSDDLSADPTHAVLETLNHVPSGEAVHLQFVLSAVEPHQPLWKHLAIVVFDLIKNRIQPAKEPEPTPEPTKRETAVARLTIRITASASTDTAATTLLQSVSAPFYQWVNPGGANLKRTSAKRMMTFAKTFDARHADPKQSFFVTAAELASLYHLPTNPRLYARLQSLSSTHLPPPHFAPHPQGLVLGTSRWRDRHQPVVIPPEDRLRHTYLIGQTGTGKSSLFQSLFLQDVTQGNGGCFIDPHGEAIEWLLERLPKDRLQDVLLFDPSNTSTVLGLNLLEWHTPEERDLIIQELILLFYKIFDPDHTGVIGPQFEHWLRNAALTVTEPSIRGTLADIPRLFTDKEFQQTAAKQVTHPAAKRFWNEQMVRTSAYHQSEMLNYFTSKFGAFLGNTTMQTILTQQNSAFDMRAVMDNKKILLVNLSKGTLGELNAQLLGTILLAKLQVAAMGRAAQPVSERTPFYVYIDEFHTIATDSFSALLSEVRKYGVGLHITHQYSAQLSQPLKDAIVGNVGTLLAFRLGHDDAQWLAEYFTPLTADDLTHIDAYHLHCRTLKNGASSSPFTLQAYHATVPAITQKKTITHHRMKAASTLLALRTLPNQPSATLPTSRQR